MEAATAEAKARELEELENQLLQIDGATDLQFKSLHFRQASEVDQAESAEAREAKVGYVSSLAELNEPPVTRKTENKSKSKPDFSLR